eukprot:maker-scaffold59_size442576-snap-gene-3.27 protein:Tk11676 transcript:maker-scaffold59_size442576-snap-gene-3.27-mRNA-1 annotation:"hypothetical protein SINV_11867"
MLVGSVNILRFRHSVQRRSPRYNNGHHYNHYPQNNYHHSNQRCGPFRRRACRPALRAAAVVGTAAFGGALLGSGLRGK